MRRRELLTAIAAAGAAATATTVPSERALAANDGGATPRRPRPTFIASHDGTNLYWREWGRGIPVMSNRGIRCLAYDRRGHGRSDQPASGYDYDTLADDMASVIEALDLKDLALVGHSMGGSEIVRYLTRHGSARVKRIVLLAPILPFFTKTTDNPYGVPAEILEAVRGEWRKDFSKWLADNVAPFFTPETSPELMK